MDNHDEINRTMGLILGELKGINQQFDGVNSTLRSHSLAIDDLKTFKEQHVGKATLISVFMSALFGIVGAFIGRHF